MFISRRSFLSSAAAGAMLAVSSLNASADVSTSLSDLPNDIHQSPKQTAEGAALTAASEGRLGYPLTPQEKAEIRKQLATYPGDNSALLVYPLPHSVGPTMAVSMAVPTVRR